MSSVYPACQQEARSLGAITPTSKLCIADAIRISATTADKILGTIRNTQSMVIGPVPEGRPVANNDCLDASLQDTVIRLGRTLELCEEELSRLNAGLIG